MSFKKLRVKVDYTQRKLAQLLDVDVSTVQSWEAGEHLPTSENMVKLKSLLGAEVEAALLEKKETENELDA